MMEAHCLTSEQKHTFMQANKIAIIGMPLAGKTTLIRQLVGCDLDDVIEARTQTTISTLLRQGVFRAEETQALAFLVAQQTPLLALGGGAILKQENVALLADYFVVFLDTPLPVLHERLQTNMRPLIRQATDLDRLFFERYPLYVEAADLIVTGEVLEQLFHEKMSR